MQVTIRVRMSAHDAHYGGNLVDGAKMLELFGDVYALISRKRPPPDMKGAVYGYQGKHCEEGLGAFGSRRGGARR